MLPRLAVHYSDAPWWKHDLWCLRFDPRIPHRDHEPHGDASVRWDTIAPPWLREGVKFYTHLQMEAGQLTWSTVLQVHVFAARFGEFALPAVSAIPPWWMTHHSCGRWPWSSGRSWTSGGENDQLMAALAAARSTRDRSPAPCGSSVTSTG